MNLGKNDWLNICRGASILATGGGGDLTETKEIFKSVFSQKKYIELKDLNEFKAKDIVCTSFIGGSIGSFETSTKPLIKSFNVLEKVLKKEIKGIIPVEIGPGDIAEIVKIASVTNIPVVDADIVGKRASPEIFLETITLKDIPRTPIVVTDNKNVTYVIKKNINSFDIEKRIRCFAKKSEGAVFVAGYPLSLMDLKETVGEKTLTLCKNLGSIKESNFSTWLKKTLYQTSGKLLFKGKVYRLDLKDNKGFLSGYVYLTDKSNVAKIFIKNENLILWINGKLFLTCPDLICLIDAKSKLGIYNRDLMTGQEVLCIGIPSLNIWRAKKGLNLFSPKTFGFNLKPKLLK